MADELDDILRMATETEVAERRLNAAIADTTTGLQKMLVAGTIGQQQFAAATVDLGQKLKAVFAEQSAGHQKFIQQQLEAKKSLFGTVDATAAIAKGAVAADAAQTKFNAAVAETAKKLQAMLASGKIAQTQYNIATQDLGKNVKVVLDRQEELTKATKTGFVGALQGVRAAIGEVTSNFFTAQGAIQSMMAVTSPAAFQTFTGSVEILTRQIGMAFIPEVMKVSFWLQDAANWIRNMDQGTKDSIFSWASWVLEIGGAVAAFGMAYKVVSMLLGPLAQLWPLLRLARVGFMSLWAAMGPLGALAIAAAAVAAAVGLTKFAAWGAGKAMDALDEKMAATGAKGKLEHGGELTEKELKTTLSQSHRQFLDDVRASSGEKGYRWGAGKVADEIKERQQAIEEMGGPAKLAEQARQAAAQVRAGMSPAEALRTAGIDKGLEARLGGGYKGDTAARAVGNIWERATGERPGNFLGKKNAISKEGLDIKLEQYADAMEKTKDVSDAQIGSLRRIAAGEKPGQQPDHKMASQKEMAVQMTAIEQARATFQQSALQDPMEAQKLKEQREANIAAQKQYEIMRRWDEQGGMSPPAGIPTNANKGGMQGGRPQ